MAEHGCGLGVAKSSSMVLNRGGGLGPPLSLLPSGHTPLDNYRVPRRDVVGPTTLGPKTDEHDVSARVAQRSAGMPCRYCRPSQGRRSTPPGLRGHPGSHTSGLSVLGSSKATLDHQLNDSQKVDAPKAKRACSQRTSQLHAATPCHSHRPAKHSVRIMEGGVAGIVGYESVYSWGNKCS